MVTRAWGTVNGREIILWKKDGNIWAVDVPRFEDGEYIVELYAQNEAGVTGFFGVMLFAISGHQLKCARILRGYAGKSTKTGFSGSLGEQLYQAEREKRGYCIERIICR